MGWIRNVHNCPRPPDPKLGEVWRCDICGQIWVVERGWYSRQPQWFQATLWQRLRYRRYRLVGG